MPLIRGSSIRAVGCFEQDQVEGGRGVCEEIGVCLFVFNVLLFHFGIFYKKEGEQVFKINVYSVM